MKTPNATYRQHNGHIVAKIYDLYLEENVRNGLDVSLMLSFLFKVPIPNPTAILHVGFQANTASKASPQIPRSFYP